MFNESFDWDEAKNLANQEKHNVSFDEARYAFNDENRIIDPDPAHSQHEARYFCVGMNREQTDVLTVRFTYRNDHIRIFGAGYWRAGRKQYEKAKLLR